MHTRPADPPRLPLEPAGPQFPFNGGNPPTIAGHGWLVVVLAVAAGFAAFTAPLPFADDVLTGWLRVAAFVGLPLAALRMAAPTGWTAIFRRVGGREVKLMFAFAFANIVITMTIGFIIQTFGTVIGNSGIADAGQLEGARLANFFAKVAPQLLGEELLTILPFLAMIAFCHDRLGIRSGGENGWWELNDVRVSRDAITARYRLNGLNKPRLTINRRTGRINIDGIEKFRGECDQGNWAERKNRF